MKKETDQMKKKCAREAGQNERIHEKETDGGLVETGIEKRENDNCG